MWGLLLGVALAQPVAGECSRHIPIRKGEALPLALAGSQGAKCSAVAVPLSDLADYLKLEDAMVTADKLHALDVTILKQERDHYKTALEEAQDLKWYEKPAAHRWAGRLDVIIVAAAITGTVTAVYNAGQK
jgi:hypothetical protein